MARTSLKTYRKKRDFAKTAEPEGTVVRGTSTRFVLHEHHASRLHFDLRLEMGGVLKSFAVPKGPSLDPKEKRLAVNTEDHPIQYLDFQGTIADGQYGAGEMRIRDTGTYALAEGGDPLPAYDKGRLHLVFHGERLRGAFMLVRIARGDGRRWLLFKLKDEEAVADWTPALILPAGAAPSALPAFVEPMLATLADTPFDDPDWIFESKWDGWRAQLRFDGKGQTLISRSGGSLDAMFPELADIHRSLPVPCVLDGEVVALDAGGNSRFQLLQNRLKGRRRSQDAGGAMVFYVFDVPWCAGRDLRACPLLERKEVLRALVPPGEGPLRYSEHQVGRGKRVFEQAVKLGFEGMVAKRAAGPYRAGRSEDWLKIKVKRRQEIVLCGMTEPRGSRRHFGSLVGGLYEDGRLRFVGHVGGGFNARLLEEVHGLLSPLKTKKSPFAETPKTNEKVEWLKPKAVAEVEFAEWTEDGRMRQPIFLGLRPDKDPKDCVRESEKPSGALKQAAESHASEDGSAAPEVPAPAHPRMPVLSNLDKVYWPGEGYTKGDLIRYYDKVSGFILPHLKGRPLILKRYPDGIGRPPFFQHAIKNPPAWLATAEDREESRGRLVRYAICDNRESLLYLANLGVIPLHPFLSRVPHLERPDWAVFDLDPQDGPFDEVCEAALALKKLLDALGLKSFAKTSGSRGMHVFVPLKPAYIFEQSLSFARRMGALAVKEEPGLFTVERSLKLRKRAVIYLDCMQNSRGKSVASVYCVREKPGATVSAALEWSEVKKKPDLADFTMETMPRRLAKTGDLFSGVFRVRNSLEPALARLDGLLRK